MSNRYVTDLIDCMKDLLYLGCAGCLEGQKGFDFHLGGPAEEQRSRSRAHLNQKTKET